MANGTLFCNPITGNLFRRVCKLTKGGVHGIIYACNFGEIDTFAVANGVLTSITMKINPVTNDPYHFYQIIHKKQTAGIDNVVVKGTNSSYFNQTIDFQVIGMNTENKLAFESLVNGEAVFFGKDGNDIRHAVGLGSGAEIQDGGRIGTGIELDSLVGGQAQFIAQETFVTPTVQSGLQINVLQADGVTVDLVTLD